MTTVVREEKGSHLQREHVRIELHVFSPKWKGASYQVSQTNILTKDDVGIHTGANSNAVCCVCVCDQ